MKGIFFIVYILLFICFTSHGQSNENLIAGGYKYAYELKLNSPSIENKFLIEKRTRSEKSLNGVFNFKVSTKDSSISVSDINKSIWAVYDGNSFYINTVNYTGNLWFAKGYVIGRYIYFNANPPLDEKFRQKMGYDKQSYVPLIGILGGAVGGIIVGTVKSIQNSSEQISILLDIQTDKAICLSKDKLYQMIQEYPEIKKEYFADTITDSEKIIMKYIKMLSDVYPKITLTEKDINEQQENSLNMQIINLKENLYKIDTNNYYQSYYENIIKFNTHPDIIDIKLVSDEYPNGLIKSIGLEAKHNIQVEGDYTSHYNYVKIGTWRYFYENGQLKMMVDYDLNENKDGRFIKFDKNGNVIKQEEYKLGWKIK